MVTTKTRNSNIEMLRIFAMAMILIYHCFHQLKGMDPNSHWIVFFYTILHNGVPLFLLISGFFTIKLSIRKVVSFYLYCVIWALICNEIGFVLNNNEFGMREIAVSLLPFSHPTVWYPPFYFWLMLFAPALNLVNKYCTIKEHSFIVFTLYVAIVYFGLVWQNDIVGGGKSVPYFIYMYILGGWLRRIYEKYSIEGFNVPYIQVITNKAIFWGGIIIFLLIYLFIIAVGTWFLPNSFGRMFRGFVFSYQGPVLAVTSIAIFVLFLRIRVKNKFINYISSSCFAVYLMHENRCCSFLYRDSISSIFNNYTGFECFTYIATNVILVFACAIVLDKIIRHPLQQIIEKVIFKEKIKHNGK